MTLTVSSAGVAAGIKGMVYGLAVLVGLSAFAHCNSGCKPAQAPTDAEQAYTTAIIACAATAGYPGAYDHAADMKCRAKVDCEFGVGPCQ